MKITEKEFNITTGLETITEREETAEETQTRLFYEKQFAAEEKEIAKKSEARAALLDKLGITADEAKLLLG